MEQAPLFDHTPLTLPEPVLHESIQEQFDRFHAANPQVYGNLVWMARHYASVGATRLSMNMLFEQMRGKYLVVTRGEKYLLNNNYRSRYVRLIEDQEPDLRGLFETRTLKAA